MEKKVFISLGQIQEPDSTKIKVGSDKASSILFMLEAGSSDGGTPSYNKLARVNPNVRS